MMNPHDRQRIADAIQAIERTTSGELVCILARRSSSYSYAPLLWATLIALTAPWLLALMTDWSIARLLGAQILIFIAASLLFSLEPLRINLVPRQIRRTRAYRAATEQFFARGLTHTAHRSGVMIYVSLAERYVRIIADEGIAARIDQRQWQAAVDALTAKMAKGDIAEGFLAAIALCGIVLAEHAPPDGGGKRLPDRIYIL